jgi:hypothetical protein
LKVLPFDSEQKVHTFLRLPNISLGDSTNDKLASSRRNTRKNPDGKQITLVNDPEKILKARGSLKPTAAVYKLKPPQLKTKSSSEPSTSLSPLFDTKDLASNCSEVRSEIHPTVLLVHKGKGPLESSSEVDIPYFIQLNFPTSPNSEECVTHSVSTPVDSPNFVSCKFEELSPRVPYLSLSDFPFHEENKDSLLIFRNPLYDFPLITMAAAGGGGGGFIGGGGGFIRGGGGGAPVRGVGGQGPAPPPRVFAKVAARYAPLVLPVPLHDLPENYIKNLPNSLGKGI